MKILLIPGLALGFLAWPAAAEPENRIVLDISPSVAHPRNSEGSFATLKSGRIIFCFTQFYGGDADDAPAKIAEITSDDQGRTWTSPRLLVDNGRNQNVMSVSLLRLASGKLALFYLVNRNHWLDMHPYLKISADEGVTWSAAREVFNAPGQFVLNNDRVIQTSRGRLIMPVAYHRSRRAEDVMEAFDSRGIALWYLSDDEGVTWREAGSWWAIPVPSKSGLQEPGVVELADGSLFCWARTDQGCQYGFSSHDGGETWSAPAPTALQSPTSPASIKRLPDSASLLAVFNDHSGRFRYPKGKRTPLVIALSPDNGRTWPIRKEIETDPQGWYCYTAIHFVDHAILLGYCAGYPGHSLDRLRIRRIDLSWLGAGEASGI